MLTLTQPAGRGAAQLIPGADLVAGHVVDFFGTEHRVDHFITEQHGPVFDPERHPVRRVAVAVDGWELTLQPGQSVPVLMPADLYRVEVFRTATPQEPAEVVPFAAETPGMASTIARRILILADATWGDIVTAAGSYVDTVAVA